MSITLSKRKLRRFLVIFLTMACGFQLVQVARYFISLYDTVDGPEDATEDFPEREDYDIHVEQTIEKRQVFDKRNRYILLVTSKAPRRYPFTMLRTGNLIFVESECDYTNCYIVDDKTYLNEVSFDMVAFNAADLFGIEIPENRTPYQRYAFFSIESPQNFPVCVDIYDDFFNWTFTYRLDSDFRWWFYEIYDMNETMIGPPVDVWPEFEPIGDELKYKLESKTRMAAWFVSNCETISGREWVVEELDKELKERYGWSVDIYGNCGTFACPRRYAELCHHKIEEHYYFYLALENSFAEDYITEKILIGLNNFAIPVVYGNVNYSRFLPPDSYLDAKELGTQELARIMNKIATHPDILYDYFKWTNHISFRPISRKTQICQLCAVLNDRDEMTKTRMYQDFRNWWNNEGWDSACSQNRDYF